MSLPLDVAPDRRHRRRLETIEEVLDHAVAVMAEEGVAGLSLGELARRMGIRTPSLYVYFSSKHALYDALFERGWRLLLAHMVAYQAGDPPVEDDLAEILSRFWERFVRWAMENAAYAQLLFWRPVPGFTPTPSAYAPAVELYEHNRRWLQELQERRVIRDGVDVDAALRDLTVVVAGVISQQLSNAPDETFEHGRFTAAIPGLAGMYAAHYGTARTPRPKKATPRRRNDAGKH